MASDKTSRRQPGTGWLEKISRGHIWMLCRMVRGKRKRITSKTDKREIALAMLDRVVGENLTGPLPVDFYRAFLKERSCNNPDCQNLIPRSRDPRSLYCGLGCRARARETRKGKAEVKIKQCKDCGTSFKTVWPWQKFCSDSHRNAYASRTKLARLAAGGNGAGKSKKRGPASEYSEAELRQAIAAVEVGKSWPEAAKQIRPDSWNKKGAREAGEKLRKAAEYFQSKPCSKSMREISAL